MNTAANSAKQSAQSSKLSFALCALHFALCAAVASTAWAGSDMASTNYKIRRSDINSGGSNRGSSASYKLTSSVGTGGGSLFSGTTYFVYSGFSNIVSHPNSIEDLTVFTGPSTGTLLLTWTAPTAYGSTGTATSYIVRQKPSAFTDEVSFVNATLVPNAWVPQTPGTFEGRTMSGLSSNTTYYFAIKGADVAGNTGYLSNQNTAGASTLTDALTGVQIVNVYQSSVTLSWTRLGPGNAEGYLVQGSTSANFSTTIRSSATADESLTTLADINLRRGKRTFFEVGGLNWNGVANFTSAGSTITLPGPPPANPTFTKVYASSMTIAWGGVASDDGYSAEASSNSLFAAIDQSSMTADVNLSTLTIQNLVANATYYLRVGSLFDDATNYAKTTPVSTFTVAAVPTGGVIGAVTPSVIPISWNGSINSTGTLFQAEASSISAVGAATVILVSSGLNATFTGLTQDTTYWARVKALGWAGANSPYLIVGSSVTGTSITPLIVPTFTGFTNVGYSSVTVAWPLTGPPSIAYDVDLAPADPFGAHVTATAVAGPTATLSGLNIDSLYSAHVRAHSLVTNHVSGYSNFSTTSTLAEPPINLSTTAVSNTYIYLAWNGNGNPTGALYAIERSTDGITYTQAGAIRTTSYQDQGLAGGTVYAYRVRALSESGVPTAYSNTILVMTTGIPTAPKRPSGLWIERVDAGGGNFTMTYHWHRVTERTDGSTLSNLAGYQIYVSSSLLTPRAQWTLATTVPGESWSTTANASAVNYYDIRAIDTNAEPSDWTQIVDDTADMNHFFLGSDNVSRVQLPMSAAQLLRREKNIYGADLWMYLDEMTSEETGRVIRSMKIMIANTVSGNSVTDLLFDPPVLRGTIAYSVQNGNVVAGAPEPRSLGTSGQAYSGAPTLRSPGAPIISAANAATQLSLFWYNGNEWVKTTGFVNAVDNTVSFTGARAGAFQIRAASHAPGATLTRVYPRIITPNGDGWNDKAIFQFDNPELLTLSGKVYDITGAMVAELKTGPNPDTSLAWDGKDAKGMVVPGGIYIYQIDLGGTPESGTIVVAR